MLLPSGSSAFGAESSRSFLHPNIFCWCWRRVPDAVSGRARGLPAQFTVLVVLRCHDCNSPFNGAYEGKCEISINRFATTHSGPDEILKLGLYDPD